jgi:GNAT superfamily N-acetyltransferase
MTFEVRELQAADTARIVATDGGVAWHGRVEKWNQRLADQASGQRIVLLAANASSVFGYGSLQWASGYSPFREAGIPEINDLVVAEGHRNQGVATQLMRALEERVRAANYIKLGVGVGLHRDYGSAQRLYVRLGYVPDGKGIAYGGLPVVPHETVLVDNDLALWLMKAL